MRMTDEQIDLAADLLLSLLGNDAASTNNKGLDQKPDQEASREEHQHGSKRKDGGHLPSSLN